MIQLIAFIVLLVFYHVAEYVVQLKIHPETTDRNSFLITKPYLAAFTFGALEYLIESYFWKDFKNNLLNPIVWIGASMVLAGLYVRFAAIFHAGRNFTHLVQYTKRPEHKLVTDGIYKHFRHPSYFGFYIFAIGTQVWLLNPLSTVLYAIALWYFFYIRIKDEEEALNRFFPDDYKRYKSQTPTWIPFIP